MTEATQNRQTVAWKTWTAIRFIVFGVGGFVALWLSWLSLLFGFGPPNERLLNPIVAVPLGLVSAFLMLFAVGLWGRWAYLWVFMSVPLAISSLALLALKYPQFDAIFEPVLLVLVVLPMPASYFLVRRYYRRREAEATKAFT